jgi:tetratricopeptide (TPR) repeat protein
MNIPDWHGVKFSEGVLPEPLANDNHLAVWLPAGSEGAYQHWQRVASVTGAEVTTGQGLCATPATAIRARQRIGGLVGKLLERYRTAHSDRSWVLPGGALAEQCGNKESDLILVWPEDSTAVLDEARVRASWPEAKECKKIGDGLFVVWGIARKRPRQEPPPAAVEETAETLAEPMLADARQGRDPRRIVSAMTDLGLVELERGNAGRALEVLEEAAALASQTHDRQNECDVLGSLGLAAMAAGQVERGRELVERELAGARDGHNRLAEKVALEHLGHAWTLLGDPGRSLAAHTEALNLARALGDRQHEAKLLWYMAIQYADMGLRDQALASGRGCIETFAALNRPEAAWYEEHLRKYQAGEPGAPLGGGSIITGSLGAPAPPATGPGLLRMAVAATKAMAKFLASGMKAVPAATYQQRIQACAACEHHTGLRCRVCGCFTHAKARMTHENCPLGKWPFFVAVQEPR